MKKARPTPKGVSKGWGTGICIKKESPLPRAKKGGKETEGKKNCLMGQLSRNKRELLELGGEDFVVSGENEMWKVDRGRRWNLQEQ